MRRIYQGMRKLHHGRHDVAQALLKEVLQPLSSTLAR
jgi:hypothetical protein